MTFEAKLFIQGVGCYVAHEHDKLLVLFPDQEQADVGGLPKPGGQELCDHYTVVQMNARSLDPSHPELWLTLDVHKHWIGFQAAGNPTSMNGVESKLDQFLPGIKTILAQAEFPQFAALRSNVLPGAGFVARSTQKGGCPSTWTRPNRTCPSLSVSSSSGVRMGHQSAWITPRSQVSSRSTSATPWMICISNSAPSAAKTYPPSTSTPSEACSRSGSGTFATWSDQPDRSIPFPVSSISTSSSPMRCAPIYRGSSRRQVIASRYPGWYRPGT